MPGRSRWPLDAAQTVNVLGEFGPLAVMFVVNAMFGIEAGTWGLLLSTAVAMAAMRVVVGRLPVFPLAASGVTFLFGALTIVTGDATWIQLKVTLFNLLFAAFLFVSLRLEKDYFRYAFEKTFRYTKEGWNRFTRSFAWFFVFLAVVNEVVRRRFAETEVYEWLGFELDGVDVWILFKLVGVMPLSGLYAWYLTRLMLKHRVDAS